jgi:PAS domain S-box-containing protein
MADDKDRDDLARLTHLAEAQAVLLDSIDAQIWYLTEPDQLGFVNRAYARFAGMEPEQMIGHRPSEIFPLEEARVCLEGNAAAFASRTPVLVEESARDPGGEERVFLVKKTPRVGPSGRVEYVVCYGVDITDRKRAERERDRLIEELREAMASVKELRSLLPMCAACKRIRDDSGGWSSVEAFLMRRADMQITHGLCPRCAKDLYGHIIDVEDGD